MTPPPPVALWMNRVHASHDAPARGPAQWLGVAPRRRVVALRGVEVALEPGEMLGVSGGGGAGKTTLLEVAAGGRRPDEGRVLARCRPRFVGDASRDLALAESGWENAEYLADRYRVSRAVLRALWREVELLTGLDLDRPLGAASPRARRRLALSVALLDGPEVLLVDDLDQYLAPPGVVRDPRPAGHPLGARDPLAARLAGARYRGGAAVFTARDPAVLEALCDRVLTLSRGRVVAARAAARPGEAAWPAAA